MLRDLHAGAQIQILNRKENTVTQAEVLQVTPPAPQFNVQVTPNGVMPPRQVMSMRVRWNGREAVFSNLFADVVSSESNDGMVFNRFMMDCIGNGTPVMWEDML